jgi:hypothetical protein
MRIWFVFEKLASICHLEKLKSILNSEAKKNSDVLNMFDFHLLFPFLFINLELDLCLNYKCIFYTVHMWWNVFRIFTAFNMFLLAYCTSISQRCQCPLCAPVIVAPNDGSMSTLYLFGHKPACLTNITNMSGELDSVHPCRKLGKNTTSTTSGSLNLQNKGDSGAQHKHTACAHRNNSVYMQSTTQTNKDSHDQGAWH